MRYVIWFDGDWMEEMDTMDEVREYLRSLESEFNLDKAENPDMYDEDETINWEFYSVTETIFEGDKIKDLVKN